MESISVRVLRQRIGLSGALILASCLASTACGNQAAPATTAATVASTPMAEEIKPVVSINVLMVKFVDQAADVIWTAAVSPPKCDAEWEQVEYHATQLATTGIVLRVGGTGPMDMAWRNSPGWAPFANAMTRYALAAAQAARDKNVAAIKTAGDALVLNCEACHQAFKPELPTQGIITHLSHAVPFSKRSNTRCPKQ